MTALFLTLTLSTLPLGQPPMLPEPLPLPTRLPAAIPAPTPLPVLTPAPPLTPAEFMEAFQPIPGTHHVRLIHPGVKKNVVDVTFTLPDCPLKEVRCRKRSITFDYGKHQVEIVFRLFGKVDVEYD